MDVAWFRQTFKALGGARFSALLDAAKYASSSGGHKRAETYARAILGELKEDDLTTRITEKRNQDAVRALGLLPSPAPGEGRAGTGGPLPPHQRLPRRRAAVRRAAAGQ